MIVTVTDSKQISYISDLVMINLHNNYYNNDKREIKDIPITITESYF
jgi:transcription initiation factor IIF auxiliary subunit